jgi:hypothetical protein
MRRNAVDNVAEVSKRFDARPLGAFDEDVEDRSSVTVLIAPAELPVLSLRRSSAKSRQGFSFTFGIDFPDAAL